MRILSWKPFLEELVGEKPISNYDQYIIDMNTTMSDKLFFLDEVKFDVEVNENYLPITLETLRSKLPAGYSIIYEEDFVLPYLRQEVKRDFNVELTHSTHVKMIIKNKSFK